MHRRPLNIEDYDNILKGWWHSFGFEAPCREFLPENGTGGYIVYDEDMPICAGFLYETNAKVAWVSWIISNKSYRKKPQRKEALLLLINTLTKACKLKGYKFAYTVFNNRFLENTFEDAGYSKGGVNFCEMLKKL